MVTKTRPGKTYSYSVTDSFNNVSTFSETSFGDVVNSVNTPGYFSKVRKGNHLPVNPFSSSQEAIESTPGFSKGTIYRYSTKEGEGSSQGHYAFVYACHNLRNNANIPKLPSINSDALLVDAEAAARTASWDFGTFAVEFQQTRDLVLKAVQRHRKRVDDIMSPKRRNAPKTWDHFAQEWLEYRFGWRQLMFDYRDAMEAYQNLREKHESLVRRTAYAEETNVSTKTLLTNYLPNVSASAFQADVEWKATRTLSVRAGVAHLRSFANDVAFIDPLVTAYEIIPYSFIVDKFVNVGNNLTAMSPFYTGRLAHAFVTTRDDLTIVAKWAPRVHSRLRNGYRVEDFSASPSICVWNRVIKTRTPRSVVSPSLAFRPNLKTTDLVDIAAIVLLQKARLLKKLQRFAPL